MSASLRTDARYVSTSQEVAMDDVETLRYPVGRFSRLTSPLDRATRSAHIDTVEQTPAKFRSLVNGRSDAELDTPYRPGVWTVRAGVQHVPDRHMKRCLRMEVAITGAGPGIEAYDDARWADRRE